MHSEIVKKLELSNEDLTYLLQLLYYQKVSLGLKSIVEENESYEYQLNQRLRFKLELALDGTSQ